MVHCPACRSEQVVFVVSPRRTNCYQCGATWMQDDGRQSAVDPADSRVTAVPAAPGAAP